MPKINDNMAISSHDMKSASFGPTLVGLGLVSLVLCEVVAKGNVVDFVPNDTLTQDQVIKEIKAQEQFQTKLTTEKLIQIEDIVVTPTGFNTVDQLETMAPVPELETQLQKFEKRQLAMQQQARKDHAARQKEKKQESSFSSFEDLPSVLILSD